VCVGFFLLLFFVLRRFKVSLFVWFCVVVGWVGCYFSNGSKIAKLSKISLKIFEPVKVNLKTGLKPSVCSAWRRGWGDF